MKVVLAFSLFLVVIAVEGKLRGERSHGDNVPRSLANCKNMMGDRKSNAVAVVDTCWWPKRTYSHSVRNLSLYLSDASAPCPPTSPPTPTDPDTGRDPEPTGPFVTCGMTSYQTARNVVPCFRASDCDNYNPRFGTACCLVSAQLQQP
jgi:hypothetical protein